VCDNRKIAPPRSWNGDATSSPVRGDRRADPRTRAAERSRVDGAWSGHPVTRSGSPLPSRAARRTPARRPRITAALAALACAALAATEAPPPAAQDQEDVQLLLDTSLSVARKTLSEQGDFHPFAFFMKPDGSLQRLTPKADAALPEPEAMLQLLQQSFRERAAAGECRAVAVVADVVIALPCGGQSDALQIGVEHRSGWCRNFFYPFEKSPGGEIRFQPQISGHRVGAVFPDCR
jgi:hypothetical protein